jgi:hypothetical protein
MKNRIMTINECNLFQQFIYREREKCRQTIINNSLDENIVQWNESYRDKGYQWTEKSLNHFKLLELIKESKDDIKYFHSMMQLNDRFYWKYCGYKSVTEDILNFLEDLIND